MSCPTEAQGVFYSTNMSKSLPFFKFNASEWLTGNISYEDYHVQGVFIRVCAEYWNRENDLTIEDAKLRTRDAKTIDYLIQKKYFKVKKNKIEISFLNEERNEIESKRLKLSESGRKGGLSRAKASLKGGSSIKNKNKEEDIDKEKEEENNAIAKADERGLTQKQTAFLNWFNSMMLKHKGVQGKFRSLTKTDKNNLKNLRAAYEDLNDWEHAFISMTKSKWVIDNNKCTVDHFLRMDNFVKYLNEYEVQQVQKTKFIAPWDR